MKQRIANTAMVIGIIFVIVCFLFMAAAIIYNKVSPVRGIELYPDGTLIEIH
jgi:hypothetical protein